MASQTVDYVTVKGFKSIEAVERIRLQAINVLIGANGAGKSNFIEVFSFLRSIREGGLQKYVRRAGGRSNCSTLDLRLPTRYLSIFRLGTE
jgi:predicted ATPase